jgi:hypothetical protein
MKTIKLFLILAAAAFFAACASSPDMRRAGKEPPRNYPVFFRDEAVSVAFKMNISAPGVSRSLVLTIGKVTQDDFKIRVLGDFATVVIDAGFKNGEMQYKYLLGNAFDKRALDVFEDTVKVLLVPPADFLRVSYNEAGQLQTNYKRGDFINRYSFKKGLSFPYKLEQIKTTVRKKYSFNDYDIYGSTSLPSVIICEDAHNIGRLTLTLISVK